MGAVAMLGCLALCPDAAEAQATSGEEIYRTCVAGGADADEALCFGFVLGAIEGMQWGSVATLFALGQEGATAEENNRRSSAALRYCLPDRWTMRQALDVFVTWLAENPERRRESARGLLQVAFIEAFPC